ncbi:hypothetical protein AAVH_11910 [Aphelenchoides avenae]|nr:hypothetical protein AAVH_11910 [Aphelenchus avenae]
MAPLARKRLPLRFANLAPDVTEVILTGKRKLKGGTPSTSQADGSYGLLKPLQVRMFGVAPKITAEPPNKPGPSEEVKKRPRGRPRKYPLDESTNSTGESNSTPFKVPRLKVPKKEVVDEEETSAMSTEAHEPILTETEVPGSRLASRMGLVDDESQAAQLTPLEQKPRARRSAPVAKDVPGTSAAALSQNGSIDIDALTEASERIAKLEEEFVAANTERTELKSSNEQKDVEIAGLRKRVENLSTTNSVLRTAQVTKSKEADDLKEQLERVLAENAQLKTSADEVLSLKDKIVKLKEEAESLRSLEKDRKKELEKLKVANEAMETRLKTLLAENAAMRERNEKSHDAPTFNGTNGHADSSSEVRKLESEKARLEKEITRVEQERDWFKQKIAERNEHSPEAKTRALRAELKKAKADLDVEMKAAAEGAKQLESAKKKAKSLEAKLKELTTTIASQRDHIAKQAAQLQRQSTIIRNRIPLLRQHACGNCDPEKNAIYDEIEEIAIVAEKPTPESSAVKRSLRPSSVSAPLPPVSQPPTCPLPAPPNAPLTPATQRPADAAEPTYDAVVAAMLGGAPRRSRARQPSTTAEDAALGLLGLAAGATRGKSLSPPPASSESSKPAVQLTRSASMTHLEGEPETKKKRKEDAESAKEVEKVMSDSEVTLKKRRTTSLSVDTPERPASQPPLIMKFARDADSNRLTVKSVTVDLGETAAQATTEDAALPNGHQGDAEKDAPAVTQKPAQSTDPTNDVIVVNATRLTPVQTPAQSSPGASSANAPTSNMTRYVPIAPKDPSKPPPSPDKEFRECLNSLMQKLEPLKEKEQSRNRSNSQSTSAQGHANRDLNGAASTSCAQLVATPVLHPIVIPKTASGGGVTSANNVHIRPLQATIVTTPLPRTNGTAPHSVTVHALAKPANPFYHRGGSNIAMKAVRPFGATGTTLSKLSVATEGGMVNGHALTNGSPLTSRASPKNPSPWLTAQCKDIIAKIVEANTKYRVSFDIIHATLVREHPGQMEMIDAIVLAAKEVIKQQRNQPTPLQNGHGVVH